MASIIPTQNTSFLYPSKENKKLPAHSKTDKKSLTVANQALEKGNTRWYTEEVNPPLVQNGEASVPGRLSANRVHIISAVLKTPKTKEKPIPPSRSHTIPSPTPEHSKIDMQKQALGPKLSDVINAKNALNPTGKKIPPTPLPRFNTCLSAEKASAKNTPPLPPPQENKPKFKPVSVATPALPLERRVSFQIEETPKDLEASPSAIPSTKGSLKKTSSFSNTEENKPHNATSSPFTKIHSSPESNKKPNEEEELSLVLDELNAVLTDLGIDPVQDFPK